MTHTVFFYIYVYTSLVFNQSGRKIKCVIDGDISSRVTDNFLAALGNFRDPGSRPRGGARHPLRPFDSAHLIWQAKEKSAQKCADFSFAVEMRGVEPRCRWYSRSFLQWIAVFRYSSTCAGERLAMRGRKKAKCTHAILII